MEVGVVLPQTEIPADAGAIRALVQGVESLGYDYFMVSDHVIGANPKTHPTWKGVWNNTTPFMEPLVTAAYIAACAPKLGIVTGIIIAPQRQSALLAKQAAMLDVLLKGKLRLGLGVGGPATEIEYQVLGMDFHTRGKRSEEQLAFMRALWTKDTVNFKGRWHNITEAGINPPLPIQRPIPVYFGGTSETVFERAGRLADGWMAPSADPTGEQIQRGLEIFRNAAKKAGRDPKKLGIDGRTPQGNAKVDVCLRVSEGWIKNGVTHLSINTWEDGLHGVDQHLTRLGEIKAGLKGLLPKAVQR